LSRRIAGGQKDGMTSEDVSRREGETVGLNRFFKRKGKTLSNGSLKISQTRRARLEKKRP